MNRKLVAGTILILMSGSANASYMVTFQQAGNNVVSTGSGSLDTAGLESSIRNEGAGVAPSHPFVGLGPQGINFVSQYFVAMSGPNNIGTGDETDADFGAGPFLSLTYLSDEHAGLLNLPENYVSGSELGTSTSTWINATFSSLGLTKGTYVYSYGVLNNAHPSQFAPLDTFTVQVGTVPLPASAPMLGAALLVLAGFGYGLKREKASAR